MSILMSLLMSQSPVLCFKLQVSLIKCDKYGKVAFGLDKVMYEKLSKKLQESYPGVDHTPLRTFEWSGNTYYNLLVKRENTPVTLRANLDELKGSDLVCSMSFHGWCYGKMTGVRCELDEYVVIGGRTKTLDKSNYSYSDL
eukprot:Lithocolla_globosa_v1_NODE_115_length_6172_cov_14.462155.p8 type:complete len:141 gc:universal NODE_115_length_6172_cov_14.462155:5666-5244(-)